MIGRSQLFHIRLLSMIKAAVLHHQWSTPSRLASWFVGGFRHVCNEEWLTRDNKQQDWLNNYKCWLFYACLFSPANVGWLIEEHFFQNGWSNQFVFPGIHWHQPMTNHNLLGINQFQPIPINIHVFWSLQTCSNMCCHINVAKPHGSNAILSLKNMFFCSLKPWHRRSHPTLATSRLRGGTLGAEAASAGGSCPVDHPAAVRRRPAKWRV